MPSAASARAIQARLGRLSLTAVLLCLSTALLGAPCVPPSSSPDPDPSPGSETPPDPPLLGVSLNGIFPPRNELLVVPPSGFVVNVGWMATDAPVAPSTLSVMAIGWDGSFKLLTSSFETDGEAMAWLVVPPRSALPMGTHTLDVRIADVNGVSGRAQIDFAVRDFPTGSPPIGTGQAIWYDFEADRDATPGPDFDVDLAQFGLRSGAATPEQNAFVRQWVIDEVLERVRVAYYDSSPAGLPGLDPIDVEFWDTDPGTAETTRICVGGEDPTGGPVIGNVTLDYNNSNRASVECSTLPPTGVFPREFLSHYTGQSAFQQAFDVLRPGAGGTPIGASPYDAIVLDPGFDPKAPGTPLTLVNRFTQIRRAVESLGASLGTILAHETGHALGLVPAGAPGGGLYGGGSGANYAHNVESDGSTTSATYLMNGGGQFTYAELAGAQGEPFAQFRPLNHAYLRDRVVLDPSVTVLLPPPAVSSVTPSVVNISYQTVTIQGEGFAAEPRVVLSNPQFTYHAIGEAIQSESQMTAGIVRGQVVPGTYDLTVINPDGQSAQLPQAIVVE